MRQSSRRSALALVASTLRRGAGVAGLAMLCASAASAAIPIGGIVAAPGCAGVVNGPAEGAELIAIHVGPSGDTTDILFDLRVHGGRSIGGADVGNASNPLWTVPPNFRGFPRPSSAIFAYVTHQPAAGTRGARMMVDSGTMANMDFTAAAIQVVGDSIPSSYPRTAGIDLVLPGNDSPYSVKLRGPGLMATAGFPQGAVGGVEYAFAPIAEVNDTDLIGGGCDVAGETADPSDPAHRRGLIAGYNVYRVAGTAAYVPTPQDFLDACRDADPATGWQAYLPLDGGFDLGRRDTSPSSAGSAAPSDLVPNDLAGLQNPDGILYSGDDVMLFQDAAGNRGARRNTGTPPDLSGWTQYWYAVQPVLRGDVASFAAMGFGSGGTTLFGDHRLDLDGDGVSDAVDLDLDGTPEFFSPQAGAGIGGLGFTNDHLPLLSAPVLGSANPLASHGQPRIGAHPGPTGIVLDVISDLEPADVVGYVVDRVVLGTPPLRVRVNDQPILSGGEGEVTELVDALAIVDAHDRIRYELLVLKWDGSEELADAVTLGPSEVRSTSLRRLGH